MSNFDDFLARKLQDPRIREAYEDSRERHEIIQALIAKRRARGLSQTQVAVQMGVKQPTVSGIETDESDPRLSTLQRYARAIGVNVCEALGSLAESQHPGTTQMVPVVRAGSYVAGFNVAWGAIPIARREDFAKAG